MFFELKMLKQKNNADSINDARLYFARIPTPNS